MKKIISAILCALLLLSLFLTSLVSCSNNENEAKYNEALSLIEKGEYEAARDLFMKMLDLNQYDDGARYGLIRANNGLIEKYNKI